MADSQRRTAQLITEFRCGASPMAGIYYENVDSMTIGVHGTPSGYSQNISGVGITLPAGTYYLSTKSTNPNSVFYSQLRSADGLTRYVTSPNSFTLSEETTVYPRVACDSSSTTYVDERLNIMLNEGSTPKPYEPYGWVHSLRKLTTATEAIENPLYSDGTPITAYTLKGNEEHTGTPSPQNPVMPNGVGELTDNLFNLTAWANSITSVRGNGTMSVSGTTVTLTSVDEQDAYTLPYSNNAQGVYKIPVKPNTVYRTRSNPSTYARFIIFENGLAQSGYMHTTNGPFTTQADTTYLSIRMGVASTQPLGTTVTISDFMISEGATEKDYEPWGYKIPITNGQQTTNIYLGSVQSTRQIGKLVLDGTETLSYYAQPPLFIINTPTIRFIPQVTALCTEYNYNPVQVSILANSQHGDFGLQYVSVRDEYNAWFNNNTFATNDEFKAYLAQQYANGTPVTVWYVLATEETAAINEPLMKIGDYSDTLSNATSIPTTEGANSITVDTTVQPSEFTATWTGWHDSSAKEWDGSDWQ